MAVRITSSREARAFVVCVHGTLDGSAAELLREEAGHGAGTALVLDLSGLVTFDDIGLALLRALAAEGARLDGASPYVRLRLAPDTGEPRRIG